MATRNGEGTSSQGGTDSQATAVTKSKELCYHNLDCPFYVLSKQKSNLLSDNELHAELVAHYLRKWNTTLEASGGSVVARAMAYSNQALDTGFVRDYLSSQRSYLDEKIQRGLDKCQCITARILPQNGETENGVNLEVEQEDFLPPVLVKEEPIVVEVELGQNGIGEENKVMVD